MPRKNCRRKKIANGVIKKNGRISPGIVLISPRFLIRMKFGSIVKIGGIISAVRNRKKTMSRPGQRSRANAYAARAQKNTWPAVVRVAKTTELRS
jgi:hypothetical protein